MSNWYRKQLVEECGEEYVQKMDEATMRIQAKDTPTSGPTGDCPKCDGPLVFLCKQKVHYCAMCDIEYKDVDAYGKPVIGGRLQ